MTVRIASCSCGALTAACAGDPIRVSVCHCLNCQRRTGSAFAVQARFAAERVSIRGDSREWVITGDEGGHAHFRFCPTCGATVFYTADAEPGVIAIPVGAFADPGFPGPQTSGYEARRHPWVEIVGPDIQRFD